MAWVLLMGYARSAPVFAGRKEAVAYGATAVRREAVAYGATASWSIATRARRAASSAMPLRSLYRSVR